jgi:hypothetical protein
MQLLADLQQRTKWRTNCQNIKVGDLVIIKDEQSPPLKWLLGRITKLYPGGDGVVRVAELATQKGVTKRALSKLCPLEAA